jgi:hypothetical protein
MSFVSDISGELDGIFSQVLNRFFTGALDLKDEMFERIFERGENSSGTNVQQVKPYSTKKAYFELISLPRDRTIPSEFRVGKRGTPIKSAYFPQGYKQMKATVGRPPLELTNTLKQNFASALPDSDENSVTFEVEGKGGQIQGLDDLYDVVFEPSDSEIENYVLFINDLEL